MIVLVRIEYNSLVSSDLCLRMHDLYPGLKLCLQGSLYRTGEKLAEKGPKQLRVFGSHVK